MSKEKEAGILGAGVTDVRQRDQQPGYNDQLNNQFEFTQWQISQVYKLLSTVAKDISIIKDDVRIIKDKKPSPSPAPAPRPVPVTPGKKDYSFIIPPLPPSGVDDKNNPKEWQTKDFNPYKTVKK